MCVYDVCMTYVRTVCVRVHACIRVHVRMCARAYMRTCVCIHALMMLIPSTRYLAINRLYLYVVTEETEGDVVSNYFKKKTTRLGLLSFLKSAQDSILPQRLKKSF